MAASDLGQESLDIKDLASEPLPRAYRKPAG